MSQEREFEVGKIYLCTENDKSFAGRMNTAQGREYYIFIPVKPPIGDWQMLFYLHAGAYNPVHNKSKNPNSASSRRFWQTRFDITEIA